MTEEVAKPSEMTDQQINEWIANQLFGQQACGWLLGWIPAPTGLAPAPFSTSHDAFALAWARLDREQQWAFSQHVKTIWRSDDTREFLVKMLLDATPRQKCLWLIEALGGKP